MLYELTVPSFIKMLGNLSLILDKGAAYAAAKKVDMSVLLNTRLAPDQFSLIRQVQIATDNAKYGAARLTGKDAPKHDDTEKTLEELKARIADVIAYLQTYKESDFADAAGRKVLLPWWKGKHLTGHEYVVQYLIPNFHFHVVTAYSILRANGVDVGKSDYLGPLPLKD